MTGTRTPRRAMGRPARLEQRQRGAWKTVARFDWANQREAHRAMHAAELLREVTPGGAWRITADSVRQEVLARLEGRAGEWRAAA